MAYERVELDDTDSYHRLVLRTPVVNGEEDIHEIPVQAIGDRMEVYGLESVEHCLELIGREVQNGGADSNDLQKITEDYIELATKQYVRMHQRVAQITQEATPTVLPLDGPEDQIRLRLDKDRRTALRRAGVHTPPDEECCPGAGISRASVRTTRESACTNLNCTEEALNEAVRLVLEKAGLHQIKRWRYYRMATHVPRMVEDTVVTQYLAGT